MALARLSLLGAALMATSSHVVGLDSSRAPDPNTLTKKVMFGYQAWQACVGDCKRRGFDCDFGWQHWTDDPGDPDATNVHPDVWPDMREFPKSALFNTTGFHRRDTGEEFGLYSAFMPEAQDVHFRWMQEYGIDGVFLQRFTPNCKPEPNAQPSQCYKKDNITLSVAAAAKRYQRVWALMYDISSGDDNVYEDTAVDFAHLQSDLGLTALPGYLRHEGKPVVAVWGFGFTDRKGNVSSALNFINQLKQQGMFVMGGVPTHWRTGNGDSKPGWESVYAALDVLSPWLVGRFGTEAEFDNYAKSTFEADKSYCDKRNQPYAPVVWPGFSWSNMNHNKTDMRYGFPPKMKENPNLFNAIPRNAGRLWQYQVDYWTTNLTDPLFVYGAMFDEIDEGTAMYKIAPNEAALPLEGRFVHASIDGIDLPSDWYLQLAGNFTRKWRR